MSAPVTTPEPSPWPRRLALLTLWFTVPLFLFGGTVTTMRAGMAESGWLMPDGFFLWLYPLDLRLRDAGVFVEHHHREIGSLVGLLAIALVVSTFVARCSARAKLLAVVALVAISIQGTIGGLRVLENSPDLAFLHGALAQAVFALLAGVALAFGKAWNAPRSDELAEPGPLRRIATVATLVVYVQIVIGAWYRHSLVGIGLLLHVAFALAAVGIVMVLTRRLGLDAERLGESGGVLRSLRFRLKALLWTQVALGLGATVAIFGVSGGPEGRVSVGEMVFATGHVLVGAWLLASCLAAAMWGRKLGVARESSRAARPQVEVAR